MSGALPGYAPDQAAEHNGLTVEEVSPGAARIRMRVDERHLNFHGGGHGGSLFLLADTAFAYACNSRGGKTVGVNCSIAYLAPTQAGDVLIAVAEERYLEGRNGIYDVRISNQHGETVAEFRGHSRALASR